MSDDLEKNLRRALRPVDPGDGFTRRVMEGIDGGEAARRGLGEAAQDEREVGVRDGAGGRQRDGAGGRRREDGGGWWRGGVGGWWRDGAGAWRRWLPAGRRGTAAAVALAASVVLVVLGVFAWKQHHEAEGLAARAQVIEALRVTSDKLDLAYRLVNTPPRPSRGDDPGA